MEQYEELLKKLDESIALQERAIEVLKKVMEDSHLKSVLTMVKSKEL